MKKLLLCLIILLTITSAQAQKPRGVRRITKTPKVQEGTLSAYGGAREALMGVNYHLLRNLPTQVVTETALQRSWLEQQVRNFKAGQLKRQRRQRDAVFAKQQKQLQEEQLLRASLPQLAPEHAFETTTFAELITDQIPAEELPLLAQEGVLYRGMALSADGKEIKNILQNGLRVADAGVEANTRNLAFAGGQRGALQAISHRPITNLTSYPVNAAEWGTKRITPEKQLLVVVAVDGQTRAGKIVTVDVDIPATQITRFIAPLQVQGKPTWCEIALTPEGKFLAIPYVASVPQK